MRTTAMKKIIHKLLLSNVGFGLAITVLTICPASQIGAQNAPPAASPSNVSLDFDFFKTRVQPIFVKWRSKDHARCYSCHEKTRHFKGFFLEPLSPGNTSWSEEQSRRNFEALSKLVVPGKPLSSILLFHPLAPEAGGDAAYSHSGGRQFESQDDPDWQTLSQWVRGAKTTAPSSR